MATYAKKSFNHALYAASRPTYPPQLFDFIFAYHAKKTEGRPSPRWDLAVDLGCGPATATLELTRFKRIIGVDASVGMTDEARKVSAAAFPATYEQQFKYVHAPAEVLPFLQDASVDLMISAQAAHWFDWEKMWAEAARVVRPGGSFAFWVNSEFRLPKYPSLTPLITAYAQGTDPTESVGPYWEQPGRDRLVNHLLDVPNPSPDAWFDWQRVYFSGDYYAHLPNALPPILRKHTTWAGLKAYLQTWSSLHTYRERFPELGDVSERFYERLREAAGKEEGREVGGESGEEELVIEWPVALCLVKKA